MKKILISLGILGALLTDAHAHGGQYRGPGDVVPPGPGGGRGSGAGGPATGGPAGPATGGPAGPATPGSAGPATGGRRTGGGVGPRTGGRGIQLDDDLSRWEFWWEFNKDPYIRLKDAINASTIVTGGDEFYLGATKRVSSRDSLMPSLEDKVNVILPTLKKAIDSTDQKDINSSCMVAMAKIGLDHPDYKLVEVFLPRLSTNNQEIRETAALSIGIAGITEQVNLDILTSLALDLNFGRKISAQPEINDRTRSFACYGLGLLAHDGNIEVKRAVFDAVRKLVDSDKVTDRNIKVAAVNSISLLNIDTTTEDVVESIQSKKLFNEALECLMTYYNKDLGVGEQLIQSHVPTAIAKLIKNTDAPIEKFKELFSKEITSKKKSSHDIDRSCALALGQLCSPVNDKDSGDIKYAEQLLDAWRSHKDAQTRYFSIIALGQMGGKWVRSELIKEFNRSQKSLEKPWVALAMGIFAFEKYEKDLASGASVQIENEFGRVLQRALNEVKNPDSVSAIAIALGLVRYTEAADDLRRMLARSINKDNLAGYLCIGLALMNDTRSIEDIRYIVQRSTRRPELLKQAAIALGKMGDKPVASVLENMLSQGDTNLTKMAAIASALGLIGDRRSIVPLKRILQDTSLTDLSRAFSAVALGGVGDKELLPWNSKIAQNMNYRASVETLTDRSAGILDIL